ncbi:MAG: OmpH family outer membrane protein [Kiritimatiellae bacterium]|nr:OmpH family outer membrane protein [Kiritimatiellia bacterium]
MKKLLVIVAMVCAACVSSAVEATVDMADLVRFHPSRDRDRDLIRTTEKDYQKKLDAERDHFDTLRKAYEDAVKEARNPALGDKARREAEDKALKSRDQLAEADSKIRESMRTYQKELQDLDSRLLRQITQSIRKAVSEYAQEKGLKAILDSTAMPYADPSLDVTDAVLRKLGTDPKVRHEAKAKDAAEEKKEREAQSKK